MRLRRKLGLVILGLLLVGLVVFALGPRVTVDEAALRPLESPPTAIAELQPWLAKREARFDDITPGAEKRIVWAKPHRPARTRLAVVYVHGFSATRQETAPVAEQVARALGANLFETRLRGHGRSGAALAAPAPERWMEDALEAMVMGERIGEQVLLIGASTGATLAVWATDYLSRWQAGLPASRPPAALVLISPNFGPADPRAGILTWPWGSTLARWIIGDEYRWEPANDGQRKYWTWAHPPQALITAQAVVDHVNAIPAGRPVLPTLVIWSVRDTVVDPAAIEAWVTDAPKVRKRLKFTDDVPRGNHVIAGDIMAPTRTARLVEAITAFASDLSPQTLIHQAHD